MKNKTLGIAIYVSLGLAILATLIEVNGTNLLSEFLYLVAGFGFFIFGAWGAYRLVKNK